MEAGQNASRFNTTSWTRIARAGTDPSELNSLIGQYWRPVYAYLRRTGRSYHDAADLTQGFLTSVVLQRELIQRADPALGRFRSFLISSLKRFLIDEHRHDHGRDGQRPAMFVPSDPSVLAAVEPSDSDDPNLAFDRQWAATVLGIACRRTQESLEHDHLPEYWMVFEARVLRPIRLGSEPPAAEKLIKEVGATDRDEVYNMLRAVKRRLRREVRRVVEETVADPSDADEELTELKQYLEVR